MSQDLKTPSHSGHAPAGGPPAAEPVDLREHGALKAGAPQSLDKRLFFQLQVFTGCADPAGAAKALETSGLESVLYLDVNDPRGIGVLFMNEDPSVLTGPARKVLNTRPFTEFTPRPEMTMTGRTYAAGREADLEDWLLYKPRRNALNAQLKWAVWYPLRRKPEFELLTKDEQTKILYEHAKIGMAYGMSGYAHDIRLACHGLDKNDNEFVLGVVAPELFPISRLVQDMRKTQQTGRYMQSMGPFFVGQVLYQSPQKHTAPKIA